MFRNTAPVAAAAVETSEKETLKPADPVPLSHLALDLEQQPAEGWVAYLANHGIAIAFDDLGRRCISRADAKRLLEQQRLNEIRRQDVMARAELAAIEADRKFRAGLHPGIPWYEMPPGVLPVEAMTQSAKDARPRRTPSHGEWLFSDPDEMTGGSFNGEVEDW
jgi:hypothetical protein